MIKKILLFVAVCCSGFGSALPKVKPSGALVPVVSSREALKLLVPGAVFGPLDHNHKVGGVHFFYAECRELPATSHNVALKYGKDFILEVDNKRLFIDRDFAKCLAKKQNISARFVHPRVDRSFVIQVVFNAKATEVRIYGTSKTAPLNVVVFSKAFFAKGLSIAQKAGATIASVVGVTGAGLAWLRSKRATRLLAEGRELDAARLLTEAEAKDTKGKNNYSYKTLVVNDYVTYYFWDCYQQIGPNCGAFTMANIIALYDHLTNIPKPRLTDVFATQFFDIIRLNQLIQEFREVNKLIFSENEGIAWNAYQVFLDSFVTWFPCSEKTASELKKDSTYFAETESACCFIPKTDNHVDSFYALSCDTKDTLASRPHGITQKIVADANTQLHKEIYGQIHSGKLTIVFWPSFNIYNIAKEDINCSHGTTKVFIPTLKEGKLVHVNVVMLDSSKASYYSDSTEEKALYQLDMINFMDNLWKYKAENQNEYDCRKISL